MNTEKNSLRILAAYITPKAKLICSKLAESLDYNIKIKKLPKARFQKFFEQAFTYDVIIAVMATGIVVRGIAPFIKTKQSDPAVVVIDEEGKFVISLLSGHIGGANKFAQKIAKLLSATPVITTSSDINNLPAIDVYAKERGYAISDFKICKEVAMALIKGKNIPVYIEAGEPKEFFKQKCFHILDKKSFQKMQGLKIAVSTKSLPADNTLYLIPRRLVLGLGFHKGLDWESMLSFVQLQLQNKKIFFEALKTAATIDKRSSEQGFLTFCEKLNVKPVFLSENELASVKFLSQSEVVKKYHFSGNISEAAAYLASNRGKIIVPKIKGGNITLCIAKEKYL